MFTVSVRPMMAKKGKLKMKLPEPRTSSEQTQTITRTIFNVIKKHGPPTIADAWEHLKVKTSTMLALISCFQGKVRYGDCIYRCIPCQQHSQGKEKGECLGLVTVLAIKEMLLFSSNFSRCLSS